MISFTKGSVHHAIEWLCVLAFAGLVMFLFRQPINDLLVKLFNDEQVVQAVRDGIFALIGFVASGGVKLAREKGAIPDYVNK